MKIQIKTAITLGEDETSKVLAELIKKGEKLFWIKGISIGGKRYMEKSEEVN